MKGWQIGTMEVHWLQQPEGEAARLLDRFTRVFDYEESYGRLWLTKSACVEELNEYVQEKSVERGPLAEWIDSLPWEMDERSHDDEEEDGTLALVLEWDIGNGTLDDGRGIIIPSIGATGRWRRWTRRIRSFFMRLGARN